MEYSDDFSDSRHKAWCIYCGKAIAGLDVNRDHVPTKSLLSKNLRDKGRRFDAGEDVPDGYLPQVVVCKECNSGFSLDETYLLCVLHAVMAGSLYPNPATHAEAATILRSNRTIVRSLKQHPDGQLQLFDNLQPFTLYPDAQRISRVVLKNAQGHAYHELGEPKLDPPAQVSFLPVSQMSQEQRDSFEEIGGGSDVWPEVGSRMLLRVIDGSSMAGGWVVVEEGRYRYALDWSDGLTVRTVIWEYLATETIWEV